MELTPQRKIALARMASVNPGTAFMQLADMLVAQLNSDVRNSVASEIKTATPKLVKELKEGLPNYDTLIEKLRGNDGEDADNEMIIERLTEICLANIPEPIQGDDGKDGKTPSKKLIRKLIKPMIPVVKDGKTPKRSEIIALIKPLIPHPIPGRSPSKKEIKSAIAKMLPRFTKEFKKVAEETGQTIVDKINTLPLEPKSQIDWSHIKNAPRDKKQKKGSGAHGGGDIVYLEDLSSHTDGVTLAFTVPYSRKSIMVICSDFPSVLFEGNGYSLNSARTQLTLSVANAPSSGSQLGYQYVV